MKIRDGIHAYIWRSAFENNCNMYYFDDPFNILIDPGLKKYTDVRIKELQKDGIEIDKIKYIVNTHSHPDHFEGSLFFMDKGIPVAMHKDEITFLNAVGPAFFQMMGMEFPKMRFDKPMEEGQWEIGGAKLEIFKTPGHSPGSICVYWPEKKALACGDLIFQQSVGRVDFPGGSGQLLVESIERISKLDIDILLPGHMEFINGRNEVLRNFEFLKQYVAMI